MEAMPFLLTLLLAMNIAPGAGQPEYRQPQLDAKANLVALTFGAGNSIYFAASHDGGATLSTPVKVAEAEGLMLGRHRGPRIAIAGNTIVISAVAKDLKSWRSTDGGKSWSEGVIINDKPGAAREGLHAMAAGPDGKLFAAWLDDRVKGKQLYGASSSDGGATWSKNVLIYESPSGTICQCCHPSLAIDSKGVIHVMWRNAIDGYRDLYMADSANGVTFSKAQKLGEGSWKLEACPMDGGGIAADSQGRLITVWRRESSVYIAEPGAAEQMIEAGKDAAVAAGNKGVYAVWSSGAGVHARVPGQTKPVSLSTMGGFPQVVALPDGSAVAAWEEHGKIEWRKL